MSRKNTEEIEGLRDIFDFREQYDVVLACAFEPEEIDKKKIKDAFNFYDSIGKIVEKISKRPYLPHREIDLNWTCGKIYSIPNNIVIPTSDIVLGYLGINSPAVGIMLGSAQTYGVPITYLYEDYNYLDRLKVKITNLSTGEESIKDEGFKGEVYDLIEFKDEEELFSKLELSLRKFYK